MNNEEFIFEEPEYLPFFDIKRGSTPDIAPLGTNLRGVFDITEFNSLPENPKNNYILPLNNSNTQSYPGLVYNNESTERDEFNYIPNPVDYSSRYNKLPSSKGQNYDQIFDKYPRFDIPEKLDLFDTIGKLGEIVLDDLIIKPDAPRSTKERAAHKYRSQKMRAGVLREITADLQDRPEVKAGVSAVIRHKDKLLDNTQSRSELHRAYAPLIAGLMSERETKETLMDGIDEAAQAESEDLKTEARQNETVQTEVLVIGAGVQGAIFSSRMRHEMPDARIVAIDGNNQLGGQFRSYGRRPVFFINSRNFRPENKFTTGLPGLDGNLNSFGTYAPVQLTDSAGEVYPTNVEMGETTAINQYLSADTMLGVNFDNDISFDGKKYFVRVTDKETGETYTIEAKEVVVASGAGDREKKDRLPGEWSAEDIFRHFGNENNLFPMDEFDDKRIIGKGGGDTGRVIAELFTRLAPKEAYGKSSVQFGGPRSMVWLGTDFENRDEFCEANRPRYQRLASFIANKVNGRFSIGSSFQILCSKAKVASAELFGNQVRVQLSGFSALSDEQRTGDVLIDSTNLRTNIVDDISRSLGTEPEIVETYIPRLTSVAAIARRIGSGVHVIGPVAQLPLTNFEKSLFADGIIENTASIWANQLRTNELAVQIASRLTQSKDLIAS